MAPNFVVACIAHHKSQIRRPTDRSYNSSLLLPASPSRNSKNSFLEGKRGTRGGSRRSLNNSFLSPRDLRSPPPSASPVHHHHSPLRLLLPRTRRKSIAEIQVQHTGRAAAAEEEEALPAGVFPPIERRRHAPAGSVRPRPRRRRRPDLIPLSLRPFAYRSARGQGGDRYGGELLGFAV